MKKLGLIGKNIEYSFSKQYFTNKFAKAGITDWSYELYSLDHIDQLPQLLHSEPELVGLNVTIPFKTEVLKYIHSIEDTALQIGAVNTISISSDKKLRGANTDVIGFEESLLEFIPRRHRINLRALVLGTGGASQAITFVLKALNIPYTMVSRTSEKGILYSELDKQVSTTHKLIINTTPLGTFPKVDECVNIPFEYIDETHFLYDLVYNPLKSQFLKQGENRGAKIKNGLQMLEGQAEAAWRIWEKNFNT